MFFRNNSLSAVKCFISKKVSRSNVLLDKPVHTQAASIFSFRTAVFSVVKIYPSNNNNILSHGNGHIIYSRGFFCQNNLVCCPCHI